MTKTRLIIAQTAFCLFATFAQSAPAGAQVEVAVQYALENLTSGVSSTTVVADTEVTVLPVRTWKSVSGHYCRRYEITLAASGTGPVRDEETRCRETDGTWRLVKEN